MQLLSEKSRASGDGKCRSQRIAHPIPCARRDTRQTGRRDSAQETRPTFESGNESLPLNVAIVSSEQFIASVASERDGYFTPRKLANDARGDLRWIRERLVEHLGQPGDRGERIGAG